MDALVARAVERLGRLDVMMCNAGFGIATLVATAGITLTSPATIYLQCGDDFGSPTHTFSSGAVMSALPLTTLSGHAKQTVPGPGPAAR